MKFNSVTITLTNVDDDFASIKVVFDPPLPDDEDTIEEQPLLAILDSMLESIDEDGESGEIFLQWQPLKNFVKNSLRRRSVFS